MHLQTPDQNLYTLYKVINKEYRKLEQRENEGKKLTPIILIKVSYLKITLLQTNE